MKYILTSLFLITLFLLTSHPVLATGNTLDLTSSSDYNLRFDGPAANADIGWRRTSMGDVNNNGRDDLIIAAGSADVAGAGYGAVYIIYDSLLDTLDGQGTKNFDLSNSSNYTLRIDGVSSSLFGYFTSVADITGTSANELIVGSPGNDDTQSRTNNGAIYIFTSSAIGGYGTSTGNSFNVSDTSKWHYRIDGAANSHKLSYPVVTDINNDGLMDLVGTSVGASYSASNAGAIYIFMNSLISGQTTGNTLNLSTTSNFTLRIDGPAATSYLTFIGETVCDFDGDNLKDIAAYDTYAQSQKGTTHIIKNSLLNLTGTGNTMSLATSTNYNVRYDGDADAFSSSDVMQCTDADNDGNDDLIINAGSDTYYISGDLVSAYFSSTGQNVNITTASTYSAKIANAFLEFDGSYDFTNDGIPDIFLTDCCNTTNGAGWIQQVATFSNLVGTGNSLTIDDSGTYLARYDGGSLYSYFRGFPYGDLNDDGMKDIVMVSDQADNNSKSNSGSVWVVFNFPHTISATSVTTPTNDSSPTVTGTVTATSSVTTISGVQYQVDSDDPTGTWTACTSADGAFDETTEDYSCAISTLADGAHTLYFRAYDQNTSYTAQDNYASVAVTVDTTSASFSSINVSMNENSATISYTSNEAISTQLEWGTSTSYGTTTTETDTSTRVTSHSVAISNLTKCTDYHFRLLGSDASTNAALSADYSFRTTHCNNSEPDSTSTNIQIQQGSNGEAGGVMTPVMDSSPGGQQAFVIIEPYTLDFNAFLSVKALKPFDLISSLIRPNLFLAGGENGLFGMKLQGTTYWQVGRVQEIWYKAYPGEGSTSEPAKIIPELQKKPSIIALSYTSSDLIPPGQPNKKFNPKNFRLAHSFDGRSWTVLKTSVVDTVNHTVAALHKVGGFYMIVGK